MMRVDRVRRAPCTGATGRSAAKRALLIAAFVCSTACGLSDEDRAAIDAWMECDDCPVALGRAVSVGAPAVAPLSAALLRGPPADRRDAVRRRARRTYARAAPLAMSEAEYVDSYVKRLDARYQVRAARALGQVGVAGALDTLRLALANHAAGVVTYHPDVLLAIQRALGEATYAPFTGTVSVGLSPRASAGFLETVTVHAGPGGPWDGDEDVRLVGAPFPDGLVTFRFGDSLWFVAAAPIGEYPLLIDGIGVAPTKETERTTLFVNSFDYVPHTPSTAPNLAGGPFPLTVYMKLSATNPDDYYRFQPSANLTVTATAEWIGSADIDLLWWDCTATLLINNDGETLANPETSSLVIPGGACRLLRVGQFAGGDGPEVVRLVITSP